MLGFTPSVSLHVASYRSPTARSARQGSLQVPRTGLYFKSKAIRFPRRWHWGGGVGRAGQAEVGAGQVEGRGGR